MNYLVVDDEPAICDGTLRRLRKIIRPGDRIAQLLILPILRPTIEIAESLPDTARGSGGGGSAGG